MAASAIPLHDADKAVVGDECHLHLFFIRKLMVFSLINVSNELNN